MASSYSLYGNLIMTGVMKFLVTFWIIVIINQISGAQLKDDSGLKSSICQGKNGILMPMFGKCRGYYICNDGQAIAGSCDEDSRFNPLTLHCDDADNVICPYEISADDEDESDMDSSEEDQFDQDSDEVEEPPIIMKPVKRPAKPSKEPYLDICSGKRNGVALPKTGSCTEYYVCKSKKPQLRHCPGRQQFSSTRKICMKASLAKCSIIPEEPQPSPAITAGFCSDEKQDALVPHKDDCNKFLLCSNMMFLVMDCPQGLHFNAQAKRCDYPKVAQCNIDKKATKKINRKQLNKRK
ncbi:PREDICTED: probable chitinase 3, partial [Drosophila arizonae]|uniref:Probable chitinase 3 n=1 Tax=Drosophila arizonae TaxID=7263 RepID=A0ABM1P0K6_DROAR